MAGIGWWLALAQAAGQAPAAPPTVPPTSKSLTMQQRFDAASNAVTAGNCPEAVRAFDEIEQNPAIRRNALAMATIAVRRGQCVAGGARAAAAEAEMRRAIPVLAAKGKEFAEDVRAAQFALGNLARERFDYDRAAADYRAALEGAQGVWRVRPLIALTAVTMFDHDGKALGYITEARTIALGSTTLQPKQVAVVQSQYARVLLNEGRDKEAYDELKSSLAKQGGLRLKLSLDDLATRSDLAIAALRNHDDDNARKYLAYTGAGSLSFARASDMDSPACDPAIGLRPEDSAIVEFGVNDKGQVTYAAPILTTGRRPAALAFARAVSDWSWRPEALKDVKPFFRYLLRVELRCTLAPERPGLFAPLRDEAVAWTGTADAPWGDLSDARALPLQQAALAQGGDPRARLGAAIALLENSVLPDDERKRLVTTAPALATEAGAPVAARTLVSVLTMAADNTGEYIRRLRAVLAEPRTAADPLSATALRVVIATTGRNGDWPVDAEALLDAAIAEPGLPARHPLKVNAMLQKANLLGKRGDLAGATALVEKTGLTAEQCSMLGLTPALKSSGVNASTYPDAALRWGFEGWVRTEFDVGGNGKTINQRAVIAYPPFVFDEAANGIARNSRWTSSFRPGGSVACAGSSLPIRFQL